MLRWMRDPQKPRTERARGHSRHGNPRGFDEPMPTETPDPDVDAAADLDVGPDTDTQDWV